MTKTEIKNVIKFSPATDLGNGLSDVQQMERLQTARSAILLELETKRLTIQTTQLLQVVQMVRLDFQL